MRRFPLLIFLLFLLIGCGSPPPPANPVPHTLAVDPMFQPFYAQYGGERVFGRPLTEPFTPTVESPIMQYFANARLDFDGQSVQLYPLGQWAYEGLVERVPIETENVGHAREFDTGFVVQDAFLAFYEQNNGAEWLGNPISTQLNEGGVRVQYFENGRLEWQPQLPPAQRVQLSQLGQKHFDAEMSYAYRESIFAQPIGADSLTAVEILASVQAPVHYAGDEQTLFVTVLSPEGQPVMGLTVEATVTHLGGTDRIQLDPTDKQGKTKTPINMAPIEASQDVQINIKVLGSNNEPINTKTLFFQTWW